MIDVWLAQWITCRVDKDILVIFLAISHCKYVQFVFMFLKKHNWFPRSDFSSNLAPNSFKNHFLFSAFIVEVFFSSHFSKTLSTADVYLYL